MRTFPALVLLLALCAGAQSTRDGAFVRQGRSLAWRLVVPSGLDTTKPNPIYLHMHGNNSGAQSDMLSMFQYTVRQHVTTRGGIGVVLASPEVCSEGSTTRCWFSDKDGPLLLEALRTGFDGAFRLDTTKITLHGGSQGSCFLDNLLQNHRMGMSGGAFLDCGCHSTWFDKVPDSSWARKFKVFVSSTTEDFLHEDGVAAADHFRWWSRLPTRASLLNPGGHCETPAQVRDSALDWLTGRIEIPEPPFESHWERIAPLQDVAGLVVTKGGVVWVSNSVRDTSYVWNSHDGGQSWKQVWTKADSSYTWKYDTSTYTSKVGLGGLAVQGEGVVLSHLRVLHHLRPDGSQRVLPSPGASVALASDASGRLWTSWNTWQWSLDTGKTWKAIPAGWQAGASMDRTVLGVAGLPFPLVRYGQGRYQILTPTEDFTRADSSLIPDTMFTVARHGSTVWSLSWDGKRQNLHRRVGTGAWEKRPWPTAEGLVADTIRWRSALDATPDGRLMVLGTPSFLEQPDGSWKRMPGGWFDFADDPGAFAPDGRILRVAGMHGIMAWIPRADLSIWNPLSVQPRNASRGGLRTRREGAFLVLPSEGTWNVRWLDARGRTLRSATLPGASRLEARPEGTAIGPQWIEVSGPSVRELFPVLR